MSPHLSPVGHKPGTNAQRGQHDRYVRWRRKRAYDAEAIARDFDFEVFCYEAGICPSPQSCLSPVIWDRVTSLYDGLNLEHVPGRAADYPNERRRARREEKV